MELTNIPLPTCTAMMASAPCASGFVTNTMALPGTKPWMTSMPAPDVSIETACGTWTLSFSDCTARTSGDAGGGESLTSMAIIAPTSMLTESGVAASVGASSTILHGTVFGPAPAAMTAPLDGATPDSARVTPLVGFFSCRLNAASPSATELSRMGMETVLSYSPAANDTVPLTGM